MSSVTPQAFPQTSSPTSPAQYFIFISHSSADTWVASQIARRVKESGATPFLDEAQIEIGADFEKEILKFLEKTQELIVYLTPWSLNRPYVWAEIGACWAKGIPIIVLLHGITLEDLHARAEIPTFIKMRDLILLNEVETYFSQLSWRTDASLSKRD